MAKVSVRVKKQVGIRLTNPLALPVRVQIWGVGENHVHRATVSAVIKSHESVLIPVPPGPYELQATIFRYDDVGNEVDLGDAGWTQTRHVEVDDEVLLSESDMAADDPLRSLGDMIQEMQKKEEDHGQDSRDRNRGN